jgi:tRNA (mo5U34)-methyltransferase
MDAEPAWWHSFELPDGAAIEGVNSLESQRMRLAQFPIPGDLAGKRVLDVGAWDGWFSFELERRGAEVTAIDVFDNPRFREMRSAFGSRVGYRTMDVYELSPESMGMFDIVLFLGVLVHLRHPLLALERVRSVTRGIAAVESMVLGERFARDREVERPLMEFVERDEFGGGTRCLPTLPCLLAFCRSAGFGSVAVCGRSEFGVGLVCER